MEVAIKRFKLISCGVFRNEVESVRDKIPDDIELTEVWLEQGLHINPGRLNSILKAEIAATEAKNEKLDAILLGYGMCSYGTIDVKSDRYMIVVPRAHDCITFFLGSKERYSDEFSKQPGTYWFTTGMMNGDFQPGLPGKYHGVYREYEKKYEEYLEKFGDSDLAKFVIDNHEQSWIKNYSRGVFINNGLPGESVTGEHVSELCSDRNWQFEEMRGDLNLVADLVSGRWDNSRFLIVQPGETIIGSGTEEILTTSKPSEY